MEIAITTTHLYRPDDTFNRNYEARYEETLITVDRSTTLGAARRLYLENEGLRVTILNFASARKPGGGFINGAIAQEESIARSSGLYPCIVQMDEMYSFNSQQKNLLYSNYIIYSPDVPVIRDDSSLYLIRPYYVSIITSPAVNAKCLRERENNIESEIERTMLDRIHRIISIAALQQTDVLILGAWGCGVFGNKPVKIASYFHRILNSFPEGIFKQVHFAVLEDNFQVFDKEFKKNRNNKY